MVTPNNNFDPLKEGATEVFDPVAEGAMAMIAPDPVAAEEKATKVWDTSVDLEIPTVDVSENFDLITVPEVVDPATSGMGTGDGRPYPLAETLFARPYLAVAEAAMPGARRMLLSLTDAQLPRAEFTAPGGLADQIEQAPWYKKLPEAGGWTAEKVIEYKTLGFLFKATGLSSLFNSIGSKLASRIAGSQLAKIGGKKALLTYGGWNTFRTRVLSSVAKTAPENMAFLATWRTTEAARRGEPVGEAAVTGALWGLGFSVAIPMVTEAAKAGMSTKAFEKVSLKLQAKFPRLADFLGGKPEQEFIDATIKSIREEAVLAGEAVPNNIVFSELRPQAQNIIKGLARQYKKAWQTAQAQRPMNRVWSAGVKKEAKQPSQAIVKPTKPAQDALKPKISPTVVPPKAVSPVEIPKKMTRTAVDRILSMMDKAYLAKDAGKIAQIKKALSNRIDEALTDGRADDARAAKEVWIGVDQIEFELAKAAKAKPLPTAPKAAPSKPDVKTLTDKALKQLGQAERPRAIIEVEKTKELGKRAARSAMAAELAEGEGRLSAALGQLKGQLTEYKRPDFTPLKETMPQNEIDSLHDDIWKRPHNPDHFSKLNTAKAWSKVVEGFVPTRREILLLEKQWGKEFAKGLLKKRPLGDRAWDTAADISNFMRTMLAGGDMSVAGRQLRVLGQRYPIEFGKAVGKGFGAYKSEELSKIMRKEYEASEYHKEAKKYVQFFEPAGTEAVPPSERPEWYMSHYPEKVPVLGHIIRMGNRNYVETMNMMTQLVWDKLRAQDVINSVEPTEADLALRGKWLMSMSGRPEIGGVVGRRIAPIASGFFFAPRFAVSRFTSPMYLRHYASGDPVAREVGRNTAKAFAAFIGTNIAALSLLKLALGDKVEIELDPRSPDWGKGKIGNLRIDLWAGYQQAARFLVQMTLGQYKTQAGRIKETERLDTVGRFIRGKENPLVSLISDLYKGKTYEGDRPFSPPDGKAGEIMDELKIPELIQGVGKETYNRMLFMWVQDFVDASVNDGWPLGFVAGALSFFGNNTASYEDTAFTKVAKFKDNIAQTEYGKRWSDLNSSEQKRLERTNKQVLFDLELQANIEGARRDDYDYVGRLIEDEKKAGKKVYKKLKPENRKLLDNAGISLGLSRKIGDWEINDERYEQYQEFTAEILDEKLSKLGDLSDIPAKRKVAKIELRIQISKDKAKNMVRREAKRE